MGYIEKGTPSDIYMNYCWVDEDGYALSETIREYFPDIAALYRRKEELEGDYAHVYGVHVSESSPVNGALII